MCNPASCTSPTLRDSEIFCSNFLQIPNCILVPKNCLKPVPQETPNAQPSLRDKFQ